VAVAILLFVRSNTRSVIRRVHDGAQRHSLKVRPQPQADYLRANGRRIAIVEAEGILFFGTADRLTSELEALAGTADQVILDLRHVIDVDATGARLVGQIALRLNGKGQRLRLSSVTAQSWLGASLVAHGTAVSLPLSDWHPDLDTALEVTEEAILASNWAERHSRDRLALAQTTLGERLSEPELDFLHAHLVERQVPARSHVFRQGEAGDSLFVATDGTIDIRLPLGNGHSKRIAAFAPGVVFGEMALLDGKPRSADALTDADTTVLELTRGNFDAIQQSHPELARKIFLNLARHLAERVRSMTLDLRAAEEN